MPVLPRTQEHSTTTQKSTVGATAALEHQHIHNKPKKKVSLRNDDGNFFGTPPFSPSSSSPVASQGKPPVLLDGPYRNSLKRSRVTSGNSTKDESWPPKRRKKMGEDVDVTNRPVEIPGVGNARGKAGQLRPPAQVNAVASSSKVLLPNPPHPRAKPTNLLKMIYAKETSSSGKSHKNNSLPNNSIQAVTNDGPKSVHTDAIPLPKVVKDTKLTLRKKHDVACSSTPKSVLKRRLITSPNDTARQLTRSLPVVDDPFITKNSLNKGIATVTSSFGNLTYHDKPRRIDLRRSLNATTRRSSNISSRTSTSSTPRHSITSLSPEDQEIANKFLEVMARNAKRYGFDMDVAVNAFCATKSLEKTYSFLQHAKEVTNSTTNVLLAELADQSKNDDVNSCSDEEPQSMWRDRSSSNGKASSGRHSIKRSVGFHKAKRPSLIFTPQPFDDEDTLSDYFPPPVSRAGQFLRLVKQGRGKEAVDREQRRASGFFVAQTQALISDEDQQPQPKSSLVPNISPMPKSSQEPMNIDSRENDNFQSSPTAYHQPPDDVPNSPSADHHHHHRALLKRISEGQSPLNDNPAMIKLAQEHRELVTNVEEENADSLNSFEQKNNPDLLMFLSLDWARQRIADI